MRVFWALIVVLVVAAGTVLVMRDRPAGSGTARVAETAARPPAAPVVQPPVEPAPPVEAAAEVRDTGGTPAPQEVGEEERQQEPAAVAEVEVVVVEQEAAPVEAVAEVAVAEPEVGEEAVVGTGGTPLPPEAPEAVEVAVEQGDAGTGETAVLPEDDAPAVAVTTREDVAAGGAAAAGAEAAEEVRVDAVERRDDGTILIGGRHVVAGEGTAEKPYEVTWEMLISASRVYRPRQGKMDLPEWAELLNGKQLRITGYVAFPFVADSADECLIMLNQWDGCCIGVPPTPYDAIEVKLARPIDLTRQAVNYGSIRGTFSVDPYLVNNFLVGLYVMDDAVVEAAAARDAQGY